MRRSGGPRRSRLPAAGAVALALLVPARTAEAVDLWEIFVTATDGSPVPDLTVGGSDILDLLNDLVNAQDAFASFAGVEFSANLSFAGVANVVNVTFDPVLTEATLTFTILGASAQTFTFTGADVFGQIEDFLQNNFADQLTEFLKALNELSLISVTDGTPISTTALAAEYVFDRFAMHADLTDWERAGAEGDGAAPRLRGRVDTYYDRIDTDVGTGNAVAIAPSFEWPIGEGASLAMQFPIAWHEFEGGDIINAHVNLVMPINVIVPTDANPFRLRVAPFGTLAGSGSIDMVAGGLIGGGGVLGTATAYLGDVTLSASVQFSDYESITVEYESFEFDPEISQQILKAGAKVSWNVGENAFVYVSGIYTQFLQDAGVDGWWTPGGGVGIRTPTGFNLSVGYDGDIADGFNTYRLRATLQFPF